MDNKSVEISDETVTLLLRNNRIDANKKKLDKYSLYFSSLFSQILNDPNQNEITIYRNISLATLKNFVNWINNQAGEQTRHSAKYFFDVSLAKFLTADYSELLELLKLSMFFKTEKLTENIVEMIIFMRLPPKDMLGIWRSAKNIGLKVLENIALATCLDRFNEIPVSLIVGLPVENFFKLVLNVNVRSTTAKLLVIREKYKKRKDIPKDLPDSYLQFLNGDPDHVKKILDRKMPKYVQCVAGSKLNKSVGIWSWNGEVLQELTEMTDSQMHTTFEDNGKEITGMQLVGRGFGICLIGGEQGIGTRRFNIALWRYCPFSKKWYIETLLPRPRRHMAVAFIEHKLYLFGGVGPEGRKLSSVDIFNVHTGIWSEGCDVPEQFTEVPPSCVRDNKFIYYTSLYHIYDPFQDTWSHSVLKTGVENEVMVFFDIIPGESDVYGGPMNSILGIEKSNKVDSSAVYRTFIEREKKETSIRKDFITWTDRTTYSSARIHVWKPEKGPSVFDNQILNWPYLVSFAHSDGCATIEVGQLKRVDELPLFNVETMGLYVDHLFERNKKSGSKEYRRLKIYTRELNDAAIDCFKHRLGCFNLIDPQSLHSVIDIPEQI